MKILAALFLLLCSTTVIADAPVQSTLAWDAPPELDVVGYKLYIGFASGIYGTAIAVAGRATTEQAISYPSGSLLFAVVTAVNATGDESTPSNELVFQNAVNGERKAPSAPGVLRVKQQIKVSVQLSPDLQNWQTVSVALYAVNMPQVFARLLLE
jgi:hypothetical protein